MTRLSEIELLRNLARRLARAENKLTEGGKESLSYGISVTEDVTPVEVTVSVETGSPSIRHAPLAGEANLPRCLHLQG